MTDYKISKAADQAVIPGDPEHPGGWIRRNLLEPLGLKVADAARRMKINRPTFSNVLDGKHAVSRDLAYKLEALTGCDPDLILAMQAAHDSAKDRTKRAQYGREIERVSELADA